MGYFDTAQICLSGHVVNSTVRKNPEFNRNHCGKCGETTITSCPSCRHDIEGEYHVENLKVVSISTMSAPLFCHNCGKAFPWTERHSQTAIELFLEESMPEDDNRVFAESVSQIAKDTPEAKLASARIKKLLGKIGTSTAACIRDALVKVACDTIKDSILS